MSLTQSKPDFITTKRSDIYPLIDHQQNPKIQAAVHSAIVLVTGAGTGIGKAIAEQYALAGAATVIVTGRRIEPLEDTKASIAKLAPSCNVVTASLDVSSEESVEALFDSLEGPDGPGTPNVLVNNAAHGGGPFMRSIQRPWMDLMGIYGTNLLGTYLCCRAFITRLKGRPGVIVNVTSVGATINYPGLADYAISKTGMNRLTEILQLEHNAEGLRVFAIHPGAVLATEMGATIPKEYHSYCTETPQLAGGICLWLMTPDADFMKGRYLDCTWDVGELAENKERVIEKDLFMTRVVFS